MTQLSGGTSLAAMTKVIKFLPHGRRTKGRGSDVAAICELSSVPDRPGFFETADRSEAGPIPNVSASLELGEERRLVAHGFGTAVVGTGTFNFWQNAAKRGSFL